MAKKTKAKRGTTSAKTTSAKRSTKTKSPAKKKSPKKAVRKTVRKPARSGGSAKQLERIDRELLKLINQRAELTTQQFHDADDLQKAMASTRGDRELWDKLTNQNPGPMSSGAVQAVFREILSSARQAVHVERTAYLGPRFSFSHIAAIHYFGKQADLTDVGTIADVFEAVNRRQVEFGLVPIENSTDGRVVDTLEMFTKLPLKICGEVQLVVHHNLMARCGIGEVSHVYSKRQALSQCRTWLAQNMPMAKVTEVASTAAAAELAQRSNGAAAVASLPAAAEYELNVLASQIEDNPNNVTRFAVIGHDVSPRTGDDRTSLLLQVPHKPGSLADTLAVFKANKVNLTWIESFPLRGEEGRYWFFVDFEGHVNEAKTKKTLAALEKKVSLLNILGSYPRTEPVE